MITGRTTVIAHLGFPTAAFKAPMIYNPWFEAKGVDAVVVPIGVTPADYPDVLRALFRTTNIHGALVTMPHKVTTMGLVDEVTTTAKIAGACNAVLKRPDGSLLGDMFDGAGFVRGNGAEGAGRSPVRGLWWSVRAGWDRPSRPRWRRVAWPRSVYTTPCPHRPRRWANGCGGTTRTCASAAGSNDPDGLRHRGQRDAAGHEGGRPHCGGRGPDRARRPSWVRW